MDPPPIPKRPIAHRRFTKRPRAHLHADSFDLVVDVGGVPNRRRDPDEDHVLIQQAGSQPPAPQQIT